MNHFNYIEYLIEYSDFFDIINIWDQITKTGPEIMPKYKSQQKINRNFMISLFI